MRELLGTEGYITFCIGIGLFIPLLWYRCICGYERQKKFVEKAKSEGNYTVARPVKFKTTLGKHVAAGATHPFFYHKMTYEYIVGDQAYHKSFTVRDPNGDGYKNPFYITVYFDSKKPKKCVADIEVKKGIKAVGFIESVVVTIIVMQVIYYGLSNFLF